MQLLESPIPPLTAAALLIIICKRSAPHFDNHEKGMKNAIALSGFLHKICNLSHYQNLSYRKKSNSLRAKYVFMSEVFYRKENF